MAQSTSSTGNQPLIELRHVDKHYGDLHVLNDINLSVDRGEVVVVIGPSGSGCLLYTSPSPRDGATSRMPSSA